jgi:hypothetical protein
MEELKLLVQMVASLPSLAVWVIIAFYIYKISIIGSIYGVVRFTASKIHDWAITRKTIPPIQQEISLYDLTYGIVINDETTQRALIAQMRRLCGKNVGIDSNYIHMSSVLWLCQAINDKEQKDQDEKVKENIGKAMKK